MLTYQHITDINEVTTILNDIMKNIENLGIHSKERHYLVIIPKFKSKLKTLIATENNKKMVPFYIGCDVYKWLFRTMNPGDRIEILDHLAVTDENVHNAIDGINKQIIISNSFNTPLKQLRTAEKDDKNFRQRLQKL